MSGTRAEITFPDLKDPQALQAWILYTDQTQTAEEVETADIFANVKSLIEFYTSKTDEKEDSRKQLRLWSNIIKPNSFFSWEEFGLNRYLFRLAFLLAEPKPEKSKYSFGVPERESKIDHEKYVRFFADYLKKSTYAKSRYVREQMAYYLFTAIKTIDMQAKFSTVLEQEPPPAYFGNTNEEKEITDLLREDKQKYDLYKKFHEKSDKYAKKFLQTGDQRFLEQMEICSLAMKFITRDFPTGKVIQHFTEDLNDKFKNQKIWYKGKLSGFFGKKNELFDFIVLLKKTYHDKIHPDPKYAKYPRANVDLRFSKSESSYSTDGPATELVSLDKKTEPQTINRDHSTIGYFGSSNKPEKEDTSGTELTKLTSRRKSSS